MADGSSVVSVMRWHQSVVWAYLRLEDLLPRRPLTCLARALTLPQASRSGAGAGGGGAEKQVPTPDPRARRRRWETCFSP